MPLIGKPFKLKFEPTFRFKFPNKSFLWLKKSNFQFYVLRLQQNVCAAEITKANPKIHTVVCGATKPSSNVIFYLSFCLVMFVFLMLQTTQKFPENLTSKKVNAISLKRLVSSDAGKKRCHIRICLNTHYGNINLKTNCIEGK